MSVSLAVSTPSSTSDVVDGVEDGSMCGGIGEMVRFDADSEDSEEDNKGPKYATGLSFRLATRNERYCSILGMYRK